MLFVVPPNRSRQVRVLMDSVKILQRFNMPQLQYITLYFRVHHIVNGVHLQARQTGCLVFGLLTSIYISEIVF